MPDSDRPDYGELDGQPIDLVMVKIQGHALVRRAFTTGERVVLIVDGLIGPSVTVKQELGALVKTVTVKAETMAEPQADDLAGAVLEFIEAVADEQTGRMKLKFEADDDDDDDDGDE